MKVLRMALRQYWWAVAVILVSIAASLVVAGYLLVHQRLPLPWDDVYTINAEFTSAQAVIPGQGQSVLVSGVQVGEVKSVKLKDGRATVGLRINRPELPHVYKDATATLRPRTPLQDMNVILDPGNTKGPAIKQGGTIPASQTTPQVTLDEITASLDSDTRLYLQQLIEAGNQGLANNATPLLRVLRAGTPTVKQTHRVLSVIRQRRVATKQLVSRLGDLSDTLVKHDQAIGDTLNRADTTLGTLAGRDRELQRSLALLPGTLKQTSVTLDDAGTFADELRPTAKDLRPALRDLTRSLPDLNPLLRELPGDLKPLRRLATTGVQPVRELRTTLDALRPQLGDLDDGFKVLQHTVNVLGYQPTAEGEKGFLFYTAFFAHDINSVFSTQDANGAAVRGQVIFSCSTLSGGVPGLKPVFDLLNGLGICS